MIAEFSGGKSVGAVGGSVGIERIFDIIEKKKDKDKVRPNEVDVFIATIGSCIKE
jgi:histidyl-tRNA synthetase